MELYTMGNGPKLASEKEKVFNSGKMEVSMKGIGRMTKLMGMVD
jgi:hypothetical protein